MRMMYIDCGMGAAGDMLTAALLELLPEDERKAFIDGFNALGIPGVTMSAEPAVRRGVAGTHVTIRVNGEEEGAEGHQHGHGSEHEHGEGAEHSHADGTVHAHNGMGDIEHIVRDHLDLPDKVKDDIMNVYGIIADAESAVHGVPVTDIHFHEVGTMDAVADVTAVCMLMDRIGAEKVNASPVNTGSGYVRCAHGLLPVPAPATARILTGIPSYSNGIETELCTPTGAALLRYFVTEFGNMPDGTPSAEGRGMGTKDLEAANCITVRLF